MSIDTIIFISVVISFLHIVASIAIPTDDGFFRFGLFSNAIFLFILSMVMAHNYREMVNDRITYDCEKVGGYVSTIAGGKELFCLETPIREVLLP